MMDVKNFSEDFNFAYMDKSLEAIEIPDKVLDLVPSQVAQQYKILPWQVSNVDDVKTLHIFTSNEDIFLFQQDILSSLDGIDRLEFFMVKPSILDDAISKQYNLTILDTPLAVSNDLEVIADSEDNDDDGDVDTDAINKSDSPISSLVNTIIRTAVDKKVSDIHFEPQDSGMIVKYRLDGTLIPQPYNIPEKSKREIISRIKILSKLDVAKKREPQSGQIKMKINNEEVDFRVSILPVINGEKCVIRILDKGTSLLELETLGFENKDILRFNKVINKPTGLILITGPTGSGKSTTLYSFLNRIDSQAKNVTTIENPVEYQLPGINQVQVDEKHINFASALREILRQDPNVIMVGEIRDAETAENAVQAAQTGHLVFSTLHTNDSLSVISRLKRFGIEPDAITQSLLCVIAQRLVKRICPECMEEYTPDFEKYGISEKDQKLLMEPTEAEKAKGYKHHHFVHGKGCDACENTGYKGRITVYEYYTMNDNIRKMIEAGSTIYDIKQYLRKEEHMLNMWEKGMELVKRDITTMEEIATEVIE